MRPPPDATPPAAQVKVVSPLFEFGHVQPCRRRASQCPIPRTAITPAPTDISRYTAPVSRGHGLIGRMVSWRLHVAGEHRPSRGGAETQHHHAYTRGSTLTRSIAALNSPYRYRDLRRSRTFWARERLGFRDFFFPRPHRLPVAGRRIWAIGSHSTERRPALLVPAGGPMRGLSIAAGLTSRRICPMIRLLRMVSCAGSATGKG